MLVRRAGRPEPDPLLRATVVLPADGGERKNVEDDRREDAPEDGAGDALEVYFVSCYGHRVEQGHV